MDGSSLGKKYYAQIIGYKPTFYDVGNVCTQDDIGTDITLTVKV